MTNKKYELIDESRKLPGAPTVYRIKALRNFADVKKGQLGGFIQSEANLSHAGDAWVYHDAAVYNKARVIENAKVTQKAKIFGRAIISKSAIVEYYAKVYGHAIISDSAQVSGYANVGGRAIIKEHAVVFDYASVKGKALIAGKSRVCGTVGVFDKAEILTNSSVIFLSNNARIGGNAKITSKEDILTIGPLGPHAYPLTAFRSLKRWGVDIEVITGDFKGTLKQFAYRVYETQWEEYVHYAHYLESLDFIRKFFEMGGGLKKA